MTASEQAVSDLEHDLRERYPRGRVTVTAEIDRVTVEVASKPDDSFKVTVDPRQDRARQRCARQDLPPLLTAASPNSQ
jgi:hypothetical protein